MPHLLVGRISAETIWNSSLWEVCVFCLTDWLLDWHMALYILLLGYIQYHFIFLLIAFQLWPLGMIQLILCLFDILPSLCFCFFFLVLPHFLALWGTQGLSVYFCSWSGTSYFSKRSWFVVLENGTRNQHLSSRCVCCFWSLLANNGPVFYKI